MMLRAPLRAGARARRAQRVAARGARVRATASRSRSPRSGRSACGSAISTRAEDALHRALDVRSPIQFHETTGAVFDTLAQIHLIRGRYETASEFLGRAGEAYGAYGRQTSQLVRMVGARARRAARAAARRARRGASRAPTRSSQAGAPPFDALQATLIAAEALTAGGPARRGRAAARRGRRRARPAGRARRPGASTSACAARCTRKNGSAADAYHDFAQSATLLDLLGERYQAGAQPSRARPAGRRDRRALGRRAPSRPGARRLRSSSAPSATSPTRAPRATLLTDDRHRRIRHLAGRRRRCDRAADRGCGGAAGAARPRDGRGAARSRGRRRARSCSSSCRAATCA